VEIIILAAIRHDTVIFRQDRYSLTARRVIAIMPIAVVEHVAGWPFNGRVMAHSIAVLYFTLFGRAMLWFALFVRALLMLTLLGCASWLIASPTVIIAIAVGPGGQGGTG
jgi:hypothetical protein